MFSSSFWHRVGAVLGSALAIVPVLGVIPGIGTAMAAVMTVGGIAMTLATNLEKALTKAPPKAP